jgi:hypothetical protein
MSTDNRRLVILGLLCAPGLLAATTLALDYLTRAMMGSALSTWGFVGGLVGLAGFFSGFISILVWPGVVVLGIKSVRSAGLGAASRGVAALACLAATYSATFFMIWFIVIPLRTAR